MKLYLICLEVGCKINEPRKKNEKSKLPTIHEDLFIKCDCLEKTLGPIIDHKISLEALKW